MQKSSKAEARRSLLLSLFVLGLVSAVIVVPYQFQSEASSQGGKKGLFIRTESHDEGLPNYDIREAKSDEVSEALIKFRNSVGKDASAVASSREDFVRGEEAIKSRIPNVKIEYNMDIRTPEVITPDVWRTNFGWLSGPTEMKRSEVLRNFVKQNDQLVGVDAQQADALQVTADYTNPDGNISYAHLEQRINGVPVFRGEIKAGFTKSGEMIRVINNLAPFLNYEGLSTDFRDPLDAVKAAARHINYELKPVDVARNDAASNDLKTVFGNGDWATTAEKMYFPTEPGVAVPSWRVLIWQPVNAYYVIVDAETGTMLWRKNITEDQTQSATYQVYNNPNAFMHAADSPSVLSPGPIDPTVGTQGVLGTRTNVTLIGNEAPHTFNNNGWITDGANHTDGNAVEAGIDRDGTNGVDAPQVGNPSRVFDSTWNPPPGNPAPGDAPLDAPAQRGAVIQMFYVMNRYHDELYKRGFTEQAFNFQADNFGRGGTGADRVSAEGQDSSGTNNANFSTPADGGRGRMQMYVWTGPTPDYDGTADAEVIIHEVTHGTSNRLHGNAAGLSNNMSRGMGEGWSDFYSYALLAEPTDSINGIYTTGGYATYLISAGFTGNYYYGIRRFPRAPIAFVGANGKPHAPFTFRHLNAGCTTEIGTSTTIGTISAFPRGPIGGTQCDQVHNAGEIWSSTLWEVRSIMVQRLGFANGTRDVLQVVTDGMKLAPLGPTFLQERDAIIAAANTISTAHANDVREGFRRRGMGFFAAVNTVSPAAVVESFDPPNALVGNPITVSDSTGDNDGFPEPGEPILVSVPVVNNAGATVNNVQVSITGGGTVNYGNINDGQTVTNNIPYTVPANAPCGSMHEISIGLTSSAGTNAPRTHSFRLGAPVGGAPATFSSNTLVNMPNGQPTTTSGPAAPYPTTINVSGLTGNKVIKLELTGVTHTFPGDLDFLLVGPGGQKYIFASDSGGGGDVSNLNISFADGAAAQPSTSQWVAGEFRPYNSGANDPFDAPAPAGPYANAAPAGADTFASVFGSDGTAMNGAWSLYIDDDAGGDFGTLAGWKLTFEANDFECNYGGPPTAGADYDFDGDGKTDIGIFRPSAGEWWYTRSSDGAGRAFGFGTGTDKIVPVDFTGDGKTDVGIFRPSTGFWYVMRSEDNTFYGFPFGTNGDVPVPGDYDNDGKADAAVFRGGSWFILLSSNGSTRVDVLGTAGDLPVTDDYDGDGKDDIAIYRPNGGSGSGEWWINMSTAGLRALAFGSATDKAVPADYTGDGKADVAIWRPSNGTWYIMRSEDFSFYAFPFGANGDVPAQGDYDGDGEADAAVFRNGTWFINRSTAGQQIVTFGTAGDTPTPAAFLR